MGKDYTNKYISTIKHETITNKGEIDSLDSLWSHYQDLLNKFMSDMNLSLVRGQIELIRISSGIKNQHKTGLMTQKEIL